MHNLLEEGLGTVVEPTGLSKKLTIDGTARAYPVYRVRLNQLFYNDQNDRIATWISQYKSEHGSHIFRELNRESYNAIIEQFIIQSNEAAIDKTQMNISLVHQREPGVILPDGRIIDGNRRFTCLRRLAVNDSEFDWFETVILDAQIETDPKQIKMLELAIQHGEEKKVDYNPIDRMVGVYHDIVETKLLTVDEYAQSTNESVFDIKKRVEGALLLAEFLEYVQMPKQWHVARDYQVVSVITDLQPLLRKCATMEMQQKVKKTVFANIVMHTIGDSRKYVRNLSAMMDSGFFLTYMKEQEQFVEMLSKQISDIHPNTKQDLDNFVRTHEDIAEDMQVSMDKSLLKAKKKETRNRPSQIVSKSISMLKDVDTNIFEKLTETEKENLRGQISRLSAITEQYGKLVEDDVPVKSGSTTTINTVRNVVRKDEGKPRYYIAHSHVDEPQLQCLSRGKIITTLGMALEFLLGKPIERQKKNCSYRLFFINDKNEVISEIKEIQLVSEEKQKIIVTLHSEASRLKDCFLAVQSCRDAVDELQQLIPFSIKISFTADFEF